MPAAVSGVRPYPDLDRNVYAMLGLVFDAITLDQAAAHLKACAMEGRRCFFSTPNVNFVIASRKDPDFRISVLESDLSLADGAPVVWIARLLGVPLPERVAGSDLFERLRSMKDGRPLRVFFFGGAPGIARRAAEVLNSEISGLRCVGFISPGFGALEEMSRPEILEQINSSGADFLVVSLGAKKGQRWIHMNRDQIKVPIVSHLGAVVNFVAGTLDRCPPWVGRLGLEWLWRIKEEPGLWRRYAGDGWALLKEAPHLLSNSRHKHRTFGVPGASVEVTRTPERLVLAISHTLGYEDLPDLRSLASEAFASGQTVVLDLSGLQALDSAALAFISLVVTRQPECQVLLAPHCLKPLVARALALHGLVPKPPTR